MDTPTSFYIAADYARREEVAELAARLESELGLSSETNWTTPKAAYNDNATGDAMDTEHQAGAQRAAVQDFQDILHSHFFIQLTTGELHRGGRTAELGVAIALKDQYPMRQVIIVGPKEQVFHFYPGLIQVDSQETLVAFLRGFSCGLEVD